jgi:uncharacterized membrane protein YqjE
MAYGDRPLQTREDRSAPTGNESLGSLVTGIVEDLQNIVRGELALAKTELKDEAAGIGRGVGMLAAGAIVGLVAFIFLMLGVTYLINRWLTMWQSAAIVGAGLLIIALILLMSGRSKVSSANLTPTKTIDSLKEDQEWASQQIKSVGK